MYSCSPEIKDDRYFCLIAVKQNGMAINNCSIKMQYDFGVIWEALTQRSDVLKHLPNIFKYNKDIVERACMTSPFSFKFAAAILQKDKKFIIDLFDKNIDVTQYIDSELKEEIGEINPIEYLKSIILKEKIDAQLSYKPKSSKMKI